MQIVHSAALKFVRISFDSSFESRLNLVFSAALNLVCWLAFTRTDALECCIGALIAGSLAETHVVLSAALSLLLLA